MPTAADIFVEELQARGVTFIATLNGHGLDPFLLACERAGMRMIDVRNEQAAGYMAEVTGRLGRTVGVCAVSGAVAHANALTGVLNAYFDGAPMLLITGITPLDELGWGNFQDFNPVPMAEPICKYARLVDSPTHVGQLVHEAITAATTGRPGPVHLSLPMDVASTDVDPQDVPRSRVQSGAVRITGGGDVSEINAAAAMIKQAERPLLIAGSGVYYAHGEAALAAFCDQQAVPVVVPIWDRGAANQVPQFMGVIGAASGGAKLLKDADLVMLAGAEFDYRVGQISPPGLAADAKVIRIHADAARLRQGLEADLSIQGSPATVLQQLTEACAAAGCSPSSPWLAEATRRRQAYREQCIADAGDAPDITTGRDVVQAVRQSMTDDTVVLVDGGNIGQWFHQLLEDSYPGHWVTCGASGVVGWGLPGAMAARALYPDRPVILLSGDGSFTFTIAELECAARQQLPFVAIVADDEQWGISVTSQIQAHDHPLYSRLGPLQFDKAAEAFNCRGVRIENKSDLPDAIRQGLSHDVPTVIHVPIAPGSPADTVE